MDQDKRPYRMRKRAETKEETRRRIVEATMQLHEEIGPRATTISAIADRAGVQRLTVYRHFPDETAVFQACTSHWLDLNPPPDPEDWADEADPVARFRRAAAAFYDYYSRTRRMWAVSHRDVADVPALQAPMAEMAAFMASVAEDLAGAFDDGASKPEVLATVKHVLHFPSWAELDDQGLTQEAKLALVCDWLGGVRAAASEAKT